MRSIAFEFPEARPSVIERGFQFSIALICMHRRRATSLPIHSASRGPPTNRQTNKQTKRGISREMSSHFRILVTGKRILAPSRSEWVATDKWLPGEMTTREEMKTTKEGIRPVKKHLSVRKQMELAILDGGLAKYGGFISKTLPSIFI